MAIDAQNIEAVDASQLPALPLTGQNILIHSTLGGILGRNNFDGLLAFLTPVIQALVGSGFVATTANVLPAAGVGKFTIVGAGTFTHSGGNVTTTAALNVLYSTATQWALAVAIPIDVNGFLATSSIKGLYKSTTFFPQIKSGFALGSNGAEVNGTGYVIASKVPVDPSKRYLIEGITPVANAKFLAQYTSAGVLVPGSVVPIETVSHEFTTSSTTGFITWTLKAPTEETNAGVNNAKLSRAEDGTTAGIGNTLIKDKDLTDRFNKFTIDSIPLDPYILAGTGFAIASNGTAAAGAGYISALKIPVEGGKKYQIDGIKLSSANVPNLAFYTASGGFIAFVPLNVMPFDFTAPGNCTDISFTVTTPIETDGYSVANVVFGEIVSSVGAVHFSKWKGKKGRTFGDSITWYDGQPFGAGHTQSGQIAKGYQSYLKRNLGCSITNHGVSGWDMTQIRTAVIAQSFTGIDFVTLTSGANDARKGITPGAVGAIGTAFNTTTYAGAMQSSIEFIINANPACKIYLITPINGWFKESGTTDVPGPFNGEMFISRQYIEIILSLGRLYSIPVCNWYDQIGINKLNKGVYIGDLTAIPYDLHPNQLGFKMMGEQICEFMKMY